MFGSLGGQGLAVPTALHGRALPNLSSGPTCALAPIIKPRIAPRVTTGDSFQQRVSSAFTDTASQFLSYVWLWRDASKPGDTSIMSPASAELLQDTVERVAEVGVAP